MENKIYTVGHSTHEIGYFLELLQAFGVNCIIDVRSVAASARNPQFSKALLSAELRRNKIAYMHFAEEFGARHTDPDLLDDDGKVDFEKVRKSFSFKTGVERLWKGVDKHYTMALMCSESDPFDCHRFSMVAVALQKEGFDVRHIMKDKTLKNNSDLERELLKKYDKKIPKPTIFEPDVTAAQQLRAAYRLRNQEIAFSPYSKLEQEDYD